MLSSQVTTWDFSEQIIKTIFFPKTAPASQVEAAAHVLVQALARNISPMPESRAAESIVGAVTMAPTIPNAANTDNTRVRQAMRR